MIGPKEHESIIRQTFSDPDVPVYGQVATSDRDGFPRVRTVHVHLVTALQFGEVLAFSSHTCSQKWQDLKLRPQLSGCYVDPMRQIQFRWESNVTLVPPDSKEMSSFLDQMWLKIRPDIRKTYCWDDHKGSDVEKRPFNIGVVIGTPYRWQIYEINIEDYAKGKCTDHFFKNNAWHSTKVSLLTGKGMPKENL